MKKRVEIIAHPEMWCLKYSQRPDSEEYRYIGIPFRREELEYLGASFTLTTRPVWIGDSIVTTGEIEMKNDYEKIGSNLCVRPDIETVPGQQDEDFIPDPLRDDMALIVKGKDGLIVVTGCAHHGILNTIDRAREITSVETIDTIVGGTHLVGASEEQREVTIGMLKSYGIRRLGACHCTGFPAMVRMAEEFGDVFIHNAAGTSIKF
jgi:7,8-dihydropterin-6-yl-methyl-4-(beta-D-ribofuranosyl)aminobenzene 5'-phosphate synthase